MCFLSDPPLLCKKPCDGNLFSPAPSLVWPITRLVRLGRVPQEWPHHKSGPIIARPQSRHSRPSRPHTVGAAAVALGWQEGQRQVLRNAQMGWRNTDYRVSGGSTLSSVSEMKMIENWN